MLNHKHWLMDVAFGMLNYEQWLLDVGSWTLGWV
jgi:hypothetical protein